MLDLSVESSSNRQGFVGAPTLCQVASGDRIDEASSDLRRAELILTVDDQEFALPLQQIPSENGTSEPLADDEEFGSDNRINY